MTLIVYITYDNLQNIEAQRSLPIGVIEVETTNWTKTREPNEISDNEKQLNSYSVVSAFNKNISPNCVESIKDLYNSKDWRLKSIKDVSIDDEEKIETEEMSSYAEEEDKTSEEIKSQEETNVEQITNNNEEKASNKENANNLTVDSQNITGNKVLRTIIQSEKGINPLKYDIDVLYEYLKSDKTVNWDERDTIKWDLYTEVDDQISSIEWRMLSAKVNITDEQMKILKSKNAIAVFGIPADNKYGFELILPYNDLISIFVNKSITNINYQNRPTYERKCYLNDTFIKYKATSIDKCYNKDYHTSLSNHTDKHHIDTGLLNEENLDLMDLDISSKLILGENTIDILIGNFITNENLVNNSCGFSKINLYIIEKPQVNVNVQFYKYKNGEIVYFGNDYLPKVGEKVFLRIDIENNSDKIALDNLDLDMKLVSNDNKILNSLLKINNGNIIYNQQDIASRTRCYLNGDFSTECTIQELENLDAGKKITIMSDEINYNVKLRDCIDNYVYIEYTVKGNYIRDDLPYAKLKKYYSQTNDKRIKILVSNQIGILHIECIAEEDQDTSFLLNISNNKYFANLSIKPGQTYKVNNLSIREDYYVKLILPQNYEVVSTDTYSNSIQNKIIVNTNNYEKTIQIKLKKKNNPYFYKNIQSQINLSFK